MSDERERLIPHQVYIDELRGQLSKLRHDGVGILVSRDTTPFGNIRIPPTMKCEQYLRLTINGNSQFLYERCLDTLEMVRVDAMKAERELDRYKEQFGPLPEDLGEEV
jgi:hypothetical protein